MDSEVQHIQNLTSVLAEFWTTTWSVPLGPIWDTVYSQTEELETLITRYEKAIGYQNQVTITMKYDTGRIFRITTEFEQTAGRHWCDIFMGYALSAIGISHLMLQPMIIVLLCSVLLDFFFIVPVYLFIAYLTVMKTCTINCNLITNCADRPQWKCSKLFPTLTPGSQGG